MNMDRFVNCVVSCAAVQAGTVCFLVSFVAGSKTEPARIVRPETDTATTPQCAKTQTSHNHAHPRLSEGNPYGEAALQTNRARRL
jgi:hypothetical protein